MYLCRQDVNCAIINVMEEKISEKEKFIQGFKDAPFTYILVLVNIIVFLVLEILGGTTDSSVMLKYGAMNSQMILNEGQWYRLFSAMFLHFGPEHLLNNMLLLFFLGELFEKAVGTTRFAAIYLGSGLTGCFMSFMYQCLTRRNDLVAGASGAIFGIVGGMIVVIVLHKGRYAGITMKRMLLMAVLTLYFGFVTVNTDNIGHIGGIISGIVYTFMLYGVPFIFERIRNKIK